MVKPNTSISDQNVECPACGARIKTPPSERTRRVRCPKCREVVVLEKPAESKPGDIRQTNQASEEAALQQQRIEALELRVETLEKALAEATLIPAANTNGTAPVAGTKIIAAALPPDVSPEQAGMLQQNLGKVSAHRILIQCPHGNGPARQRAEWFRDIFQSANWAVKGPEDTPASFIGRCSTFFATLPVSREVAETHLALLSAAFHLATGLDTDLGADEVRLVVL
jgi:phage FluMu protein Com